MFSLPPVGVESVDLSLRLDGRQGVQQRHDHDHDHQDQDDGAADEDGE
jgi:hypothetical protein